MTIHGQIHSIIVEIKNIQIKLIYTKAQSVKDVRQMTINHFYLEKSVFQIYKSQIAIRLKDIIKEISLLNNKVISLSQREILVKTQRQIRISKKMKKQNWIILNLSFLISSLSQKEAEKLHHSVLFLLKFPKKQLKIKSNQDLLSLKIRKPKQMLRPAKSKIQESLQRIQLLKMNQNLFLLKQTKVSLKKLYRQLDNFKEDRRYMSNKAEILIGT